MDNKGSIILYTTPDGESKIEVTLHDETVWLTLDQMAELFQRNKSTISRHIKNIFETGELYVDSTVAFFATVQTEGKRPKQNALCCAWTHGGRDYLRLGQCCQRLYGTGRLAYVSITFTGLHAKR